MGFKFKGRQLNVLMGERSRFFDKEMIRDRENDWLLNLREFGFNKKVINSINISRLFDRKMMSWEREWDWLKRIYEVETQKKKENKNFVTLQWCGSTEA